MKTPGAGKRAGVRRQNRFTQKFIGGTDDVDQMAWPCKPLLCVSSNRS